MKEKQHSNGRKFSGGMLRKITENPGNVSSSITVSIGQLMKKWPTLPLHILANQQNHTTAGHTTELFHRHVHMATSPEHFITDVSRV
jgi:hypothetical protein